VTFIIAISGYIMSSASGKAIIWFNLFNVPLLVDKNIEIAKKAHTIHEILPYILIGLIVIHILATLKHIIFNKVNILKRIL
jgi:cytochrome b561